jgi:alanine dehydrogenase
MIVGLPKEIKNHEYRVALVPAGAEKLVEAGHTVLVQSTAGIGSAIEDSEYEAVGAQIVPSAEAVFSKADMIVKVKEPLEEEYEMLRQGQLLFTYLHLAASRELTDAMIRQKINGVAYETVETADGKLPLLTPMSEIAGRISVQEGAKFLEKTFDGLGVLLGGVPGVMPASVVVIGGGIVGYNAAKVAAGMGARVTIMDINLDRLRYLDDIMAANCTTMMSNAVNIRTCLMEADLVIGAVLIEGARAPVVVNRDMLKDMKKGSVIVDVAIDQGGCFETSKPTSHAEPTYVVDGVIHYCVTNMPGCVSRTSTFALTNATYPYVQILADHGFEGAVEKYAELRKGVNVCGGKLTIEPVAQNFDMEYTPLEQAL